MKILKNNNGGITIEGRNLDDILDFDLISVAYRLVDYYTDNDRIAEVIQMLMQDSDERGIVIDERIS